MNDSPRYHVYAYATSDTSRGSAYDTPADTLREAKERARYCVSEAFRVSGEMSTRLTFARVMDREGACVWDVEKPLAAGEGEQ